MERRGSAIRRLKALFASAIGLAGQGLLHAQTGADIPKQLQATAEKVEEFITGPFVTVIIVIILAACGIAYAYNKDNEKIKAKIIAVVIGAIIVASAREIAGMFLRTS